MATIIDVAVKHHVDPFLETIKATVAADGADPNANLKIGNFTLTDLQRSVWLLYMDLPVQSLTLYSASTTVHAQFDLTLGSSATSRTCGRNYPSRT